MKIKANLHLHTKDDPKDYVPYSINDVVKKASSLGFGAIAITCHNKFVDISPYEKEAEKSGILLINGLEQTIEKKHVIILNCKKSIEGVKKFSDLYDYKKTHPNIFIIAPHPYFDFGYSLGKKLEENISLFDAIEYSWFHSKSFNLNKKAEMIAKKYSLPILATSDTHNLKYLDKSYAVLDLEEKTIESVFSAIKNKKIENFSEPMLMKEMLYYFTSQEIKNMFYKK